MQTHAYSSLYVDDFMAVFGEAVWYFTGCLKKAPEDFIKLLVHSGIAAQIEAGNPKYLAGMTGVELVSAILEKTTVGEVPATQDTLSEDRFYWCGWVLAYYQWYRNISFEKLARFGLDLPELSDMYILHEADISKFVEAADEIVQRNRQKQRALAYYRKQAGMTQKELALDSGVPLRMIQLYEQGQNDINKANVGYIMAMAKALRCRVEDLVDCFDNMAAGKEHT